MKSHKPKVIVGLALSCILATAELQVFGHGTRFLDKPKVVVSYGMADLDEVNSGNNTLTQTSSPTPSPAPGPSTLQLVLDQSGPEPNQAAAVDSLVLLRDPLRVVNLDNFLNQGLDENTRVSIFARNLQLAQGESPSSVVVNLVDNNNHSFDVAAEDVRPVPNCDLMQVTFRLPDNLASGTSTIRLKAHGEVSNAGIMRIRASFEPPYFLNEQAFGLAPQGPMSISLPDGTVISDGTDQLIVFLSFDATPAQMQAVASVLSNADAQVVGQIPTIRELQIRMHDVNQASNLLIALLATPGVLHAGPNLHAQYDQCSGTGVQGTNWTTADNLASSPTSANNVVIGILDCFTGSPIGSTGKTHGEAVEAFAKQAAGAALTPVRVADTCGFDTHQILTAAANFVLANPGKRIVFNASLGYGRLAPFEAEATWYRHLKFLTDALQQHFGNRVILVKSAGNQNFSTDIPNDSSRVGCNFVTVGGLDDSSPTNATKATFSNKGPGISVFAPACGITPNVSFSPGPFTGTSFAAPQVAGQLAAIWAKNPALSGCQVAGQLASLPTVTGFRRFDGKKLESLVSALSCSYTIFPTSASFSSTGGAASVAVTAPAACGWTAASNAGFITVNSGSGGSGNGTVGYSVQANTGIQRTGTITIAGRTFTVSQAAASQVFAGTFSGSGAIANTLDNCVFQVTLAGNMTITLPPNGTVPGSSARVVGSWSNTVTGGNCFATDGPFDYLLTVAGTPSNLAFSGGSFPTVSFHGALSGSSITGTATFTYTNTTGSITSPVTLNRQP
jgi:hypothetical protein